MNWHKFSKFVTISALVYLTGLCLLVQTSLAHGGHHNTTKPTPKTVPQQPSEIGNLTQDIAEPVLPQTSSNLSIQVVPVSQENSSNSTAISLLPQPGELIFLLLISSPWVLGTIRRRLYQKELN